MRLTVALTVVAAALAVAAVPAVASAATAAPAHVAAPDVIHADGPDVFPHSGDYDRPAHTFYVGSLHHSTISAVGLNGAVRTVVDDPGMVSVSAVHVDAGSDRLLASNVDYGVADRSTAATTFHVAGVASYRRSTGRRQWYADLAAVAGDTHQHLISGIAEAPDGTAYAVDELSPTVFRIDRRGHATVLSTSALLAGTVDIPGLLDGVGMTGVVWIPGDVLIISKADGELVRLPLRHPDRPTSVHLSQPLAALTASIRALPDGSLAAVSSGLLTGAPAQVQHIRPSHAWSAAAVAVTDTVSDPVTSDVIAGPGGALYALSGGLAALLAHQSNTGFTLTRVTVS